MKLEDFAPLPDYFAVGRDVPREVRAALGTFYPVRESDVLSPTQVFAFGKATQVARDIKHPASARFRHKRKIARLKHMAAEIAAMAKGGVDG